MNLHAYDGQEANPNEEANTSSQSIASAMAYESSPRASAPPGHGAGQPYDESQTHADQYGSARGETYFANQSSSSLSPPYSGEGSRSLPRDVLQLEDWQQPSRHDQFHQDVESSRATKAPLHSSPLVPSRQYVFDGYFDTSPIVSHGMPTQEALSISPAQQSTSLSLKPEAAIRDGREFAPAAAAATDPGSPRQPVDRDASLPTRDAFHPPQHSYQEDHQKQWHQTYPPPWHQGGYEAAQQGMHQPQHHPYPPQLYPSYYAEQEEQERMAMHPHARNQLRPQDPGTPWHANNCAYPDGHWPYLPGPNTDASGQHYPLHYPGYYGSFTSGAPPPPGMPYDEAYGHTSAHRRTSSTSRSTHASHMVSRKATHDDNASKDDSNSRKAKVAKDPDKPKRPLSGYNLFFKDERARMLEELDSKKPATSEPGQGPENDKGKRTATNHSGSRKSKKQKVLGVGFKGMAQRVAAKWKALDRKALTYYEDLAAKDLARYKREMSEWREKKRLSGKESPKDDFDAVHNNDES